MPKFLSADEAVKLIKDGDTLATEGFVGNSAAECLFKAIEKRFLETGEPKNLTLFYCAGQGDGKDSQVNRLAHVGLVKRVVGGHWNLAPKMGKLAAENKIEAYNFPQGVLSHMCRDVAAGKVGTVTHVGLKTFVDPRVEGGKLNSVTKEDLVEVITLGGKEQLFYRALPLNVCIIRGTTADERGNISMEKEGATLEACSMAQAVKNCGGTVIVQVNRVVQAGSINPREVVIPGIYVDVVVTVPSLAEHMPELLPIHDCIAGSIRLPMAAIKPMEFGERKIIGRRCAMMLQPDSVVNLGIGMPEAVAMVANEEGIGHYFTLTVEAGPVGGVPMGGIHFGVSLNAEAIVNQPSQFDFYDGGGLDISFLGLAEADQYGNVNVSKLAGRIPGCGGFINISQNTKIVGFCGTFTAVGLEIAMEGGKLKIVQEGKNKKFLKDVVQRTFSGEYAIETGQQIYYITERAVFKLYKDGLRLIEIAPGIDVEKDILAHMDFKPQIASDLKTMDPRIFMDKPMGLNQK